jgi:membrane carboxypeptidase/penicillin-binding protein PbpC
MSFFDPRAQLVLRRQAGTSYGFRDALGRLAARYLIGIGLATGRMAPVPEQFGLASAAPLLLQVHDLLVNRDSQRGIALPIDPSNHFGQPHDHLRQPLGQRTGLNCGVGLCLDHLRAPRR